MDMTFANRPQDWWKPDIIYAFADAAEQARDLAARCRAGVGEITVHTFPDGESLVTAVPADRVEGGAVALYRSLHAPNQKLIEVLFAAAALRAQGAKRVILITPYLPYMRQDQAFHPGEAVSQVMIAELLGANFDGLITVQPHLHRTHAMAEIFGETPVLVVGAGDAIGRYLAAGGMNGAVVFGPDEESADLVREVIGERELGGCVATKKRFGDRDVRIEIPGDVNLTGRPIVIVDDIVSSGGTLVTLCEALRKRGAASVSAYVVHALFDGHADATLRAAGIEQIRSLDCIPHPSNAISVVDLISRHLGFNA